MADAAQQFIATRFNQLCAEFSDERAIQFKGRWFSWGELGRIHRELESIAISHGAFESIAVVLHSRPWSFASFASVLAQGACAVLVSPIQPDQALREDVARLQPDAVIADADNWERSDLREECAESGIMGISVGPDDSPAIIQPYAATKRRSRFHRDPDVGVVALTSGTTGPPKRIPIRWEHLGPTGKVRNPDERPGVSINSLPLHSIGGIRAIMNTIFGGRPISLMDRFDVIEWAGLVREHRPRRAGAPPSVLRMMLDAEIPVEWFSSVRSVYTASAPLSPELADEFENHYGIPIFQGYGATEFLGGVTGWDSELMARYGEAKRGSVGRPLGKTRVRVVDPDTGEDAPVGVIGTLEVDAPKKAHGLPEGWIRTNDLARVDADGFVFIHGRCDEVIIRGGFKVDLPTVEKTIRQHPEVRDAFVVGLSDDRLGQVPGAIAVPLGSSQITPDELRVWLKSRLAPYMIPTKIAVVESIPLNQTMKNDRRSAQALLEGASTALDQQNG